MTDRTSDSMVGHKEATAATRRAIEAALAEGLPLPEGVIVDYGTGVPRYLEAKASTSKARDDAGAASRPERA